MVNSAKEACKRFKDPVIVSLFSFNIIPDDWETTVANRRQCFSQIVNDATNYEAQYIINAGNKQMHRKSVICPQLFQLSHLW